MLPVLSFKRARLAEASGPSQSLQDLRVPPGNHLEELRGDRQGQHSIRINDQTPETQRFYHQPLFDQLERAAA